MTKPLKPFLKWAGGKRWLLGSYQFSFPVIEGKYFEPFVGGGAVYLGKQPSDAILSDANVRLIELYQVLRDDPDELVQQLRIHACQHNKDYYYKARAQKFQTPAMRAAQFLYLNRTCFNGLYRENLKGQFNVPIGTKQTVIFGSDDFSAWSEALQGVQLHCCDFETAIDDADIGDFIFVDPPYTVQNNMNGFVKYNQKTFTWQDQIRLRDSLVRAVNRGASFALTNADHESVKELYEGIGCHSSLERHSVIAGKSDCRARSTELLVTS